MSTQAPNRRPSSTAPGRGRKTAAWIFALAGLCALAVSAWYGRQRYLRENPPPLADVIAPIPPGQQQALRTGMQLVGKTILRLSPEQEKQMADVWKHPPRSVNEVIEYQRKTDQILTPEQRARFKPLRQRFQNRMVDEIVEPARDRFSAQDFEKFKDEIKNRVEDRIGGK